MDVAAASFPVVSKAIDRQTMSRTVTKKCNSSAHAIRKGACGAFPLLAQLTLLIIGRSVHDRYNVLIHASMIHPLYRSWLNCYEKIKKVFLSIVI